MTLILSLIGRGSRLQFKGEAQLPVLHIQAVHVLFNYVVEGCFLWLLSLHFLLGRQAGVFSRLRHQLAEVLVGDGPHVFDLYLRGASDPITDLHSDKLEQAPLHIDEFVRRESLQLLGRKKVQEVVAEFLEINDDFVLLRQTALALLLQRSVVPLRIHLPHHWLPQDIERLCVYLVVQRNLSHIRHLIRPSVFASEIVLQFQK